MRKQHELIDLARKSIRCFLEGKRLFVEEEIKKKYRALGACFVTLKLNGHLRGCIGSLQARQELWRDVVANAINAAFFDPRFQPLSLDEFEKVKIEISILSRPRKISYRSIDELKKKIYKKGVVIKKGNNVATYLPQVWQELPNAEIFLSSLCMKAGLNKDAWKTEKLEVYVYGVKKISED
jgi:AmmeMemoRadiSam system protein A